MTPTDRTGERSIVYTRVSTVEQSHGYSLQTQAESCRRYCAERGYTILGEFSDTHSGTELDRPGLNAAIDAVNALRPDVIVLHDVDRLGRDQIVQAIADRDLTRRGARIEYVMGGDSETVGGELLVGMKKVIAVYENRQRVERSKRGKDGRIRAGHVLVAARPAYGYRYIGGDRTGRLEPHPDEAPIVVLIFHWCADEGLTTYAIAKRLHEMKIPTRADDDTAVYKVTDRHYWDPHTVARIIGNETYKGIWYWNKTKKVPRDDGKEGKVQRRRPRAEWLSLPVTPLVDEATWQRAQERLCESKRYALAKHNARRDYLLRGRVFCPCGRRWTGRYKNYLDRAYYRCPKTEGEPWRSEADCPARFGIEQVRLESAVLGAVRGFLLDPDVRRAGLGAERERATAERQRLTDDLAAIDAGLAKVERQLGKLLDEALTEDFPRDIVAARKRDLVAERARLAGEREQRLAALEAPVVDVEAAIADLAPTVEAAFAAATPDDIRQLLDLLRVEVRVIDREHVRLTGVIGTVVTLSSA
jgi:site-specific DNA recombinase